MPHLWLTSDILTIYLYCFCALPVLRCLNDLCYYISNTQQFKIEWKMFSLCYQLAAKTTGKVRLQSIRNLNVWGKWHWLFLQLTGRSHQLLLLDLQNRMTPLWLLRKVIIFVSFPLHPGCHSDCMTFICFPFNPIATAKALLPVPAQLLAIAPELGIREQEPDVLKQSMTVVLLYLQCISHKYQFHSN